MIDCTQIMVNTTCTSYDICTFTDSMCKYDGLTFWACAGPILFGIITFTVFLLSDMYLARRNFTFYKEVAIYRTQDGIVKIRNILTIVHTILGIPEFIITIICIIGYYTTFPTVAAYIMIGLQMFFTIHVVIYLIHFAWIYYKIHHSSGVDASEYDPTLREYRNYQSV